jgi:hypothetical protein
MQFSLTVFALNVSIKPLPKSEGCASREGNKARQSNLLLRATEGW